VLGAVRSGCTGRALILGVLLQPVNAYWVIQMERIRYSAHPTTISLYFNTVFLLLVLAGLNALLRRVKPHWAFRQTELLLVYSMLGLGSSMAGHDWIQVLAPMITWPFRMATPENKWQDTFWQYIPDWPVLRDESIFRGYYEGATNFYQAPIVLAWLRPVLLWSLFIIALLTVMLCLNSILRKQWLEGEHLACPLVRLPVEISDPGNKVWKSPYFLLGFGLAAAIDTYNSFAFLYPTLPGIPIEWRDMRPYFPGRPWSAMGWTPISFYPFLIGLGYLMPGDFVFSCWFFYLFWKAERILSAAVGWDMIRDFPFANFQAFGAYLLFAVYSLWIGRGYFRQVGRHILGLPSRLDQSREAMSYRWAAIGVAAGMAVLIWFGISLGLRAWVSVIFFVIYFVLSLAITRMRAQFGTPVHDLHWTGPDTILSTALGTKAFAPRELTGFAWLFWFNRAFRCHPMPHQMEAFPMQGEGRAAGRGAVIGLTVAGVVGTLAAFWAMLHLNYEFGATTKAGSFGRESFNKLCSWLAAPSNPGYGQIGAIGVGLGFAYFLQTMRMRLVGWPFHPLGFAVSGSWEMNLVWLPLLIASAIKGVTVKYGGFKLYQRLVPVFIGIILGQFVVGSILNIVSIALRIPSYMFWQ